ncbi:hypothetical protein TWF730_007875 [Orbilia blumenaviensis]|uniref:Uncharacterized protein n=1 Tax=Orbilia blumenaviensis TaxID=1796055 RepID=A0AAV9V967_9PEZI
MWVIEADGFGGGHRIRNQKPLVAQEPTTTARHPLANDIESIRFPSNALLIAANKQNGGKLHSRDFDQFSFRVSRS